MAKQKRNFDPVLEFELKKIEADGKTIFATNDYTTIGITIIADLQNVTDRINIYATQIRVGDYGFRNKRITELPSVYNALERWEKKNFGCLPAEDKEKFYSLKGSVEKLMDQFGIDIPVYL
ncbi:MAG TPA: hypothetical protein VGC65_00320 [Bacteroidia bacterium]|jgi:hypothetical protein